MDNLQKSEKVISLILNHLVELGLQRSMLTDETLTLDEELKPFLAQGCKWLIDEGIVRVDNLSESAGGAIALVNPTITAYGYQLLGQKALIGGHELVVGNAVKEISETNKSYSQLGDFVGGVFGGLTKSLGGG